MINDNNNDIDMVIVNRNDGIYKLGFKKLKFRRNLIIYILIINEYFLERRNVEIVYN